MTKEQKAFTVEGVVIDCLPSLKFKVRLDTGQEITAYLSGKMSKNHIKVLLHDKVSIELTPYDLQQGRLIYRHK